MGPLGEALGASPIGEVADTLSVGVQGALWGKPGGKGGVATTTALRSATRGGARAKGGPLQMLILLGTRLGARATGQLDLPNAQAALGAKLQGHFSAKALPQSLTALLGAFRARGGGEASLKADAALGGKANGQSRGRGMVGLWAFMQAKLHSTSAAQGALHLSATLLSKLKGMLRVKGRPYGAAILAGRLGGRMAEKPKLGGIITMTQVALLQPVTLSVAGKMSGNAQVVQGHLAGQFPLVSMLNASPVAVAAKMEIVP